MIITPFKNSIFASRNPISIFSLSSALHQWSYQKATIDGTTMTAEDFGSVGGFDMTNPTSGSLPTLTNEYIQFSGGQILTRSVNDFLIGQTTGVIHLYVHHTSLDSGLYFLSTDGTIGADRFVFSTTTGDQVQGIARISSTNNIQRISGVYNNWKVLSLVQDGVEARIFVDGVEVGLSLKAMDARWFHSVPNRTNISLGGIYETVNIYGTFLFKYMGICGYTNDLNLVNDARYLKSLAPLTEI